MTRLVAAVRSLVACTACVGDPASVETRALAFGILALLVVLAPVQVVIVRFFLRLLETEREEDSRVEGTAR